MPANRRSFLKTLALAALASPLPAWHRAAPAHARAPSARTAASARRPPIRKPPRLRPGDTVALVNPAGATFETVAVEIARESLQALGLEVRLGEHLLDRRGYLAGRDVDRAADVNAAFADPVIAGIFALRGGWGAARILPLLDYDMIREHPKVFIGYSDITSPLLAIYARTGLVTFHGPVGISSWNAFSVEHLRRVLFDGEAVTLRNPVAFEDSLTQVENRVQTINPGRARGRLAGGNLTVLTSIVGTPYLPDWDGMILFLEEVGEEIYRVDRMLTQLALAGILDRIAGFIFSRCSDCGPGEGYGSLTLEEVLAHHIAPLGIPAWYGSMIGHIEDKFTVPIGVEAEIDATQGTIRMLEAAVV